MKRTVVLTAALATLLPFASSAHKSRLAAMAGEAAARPVTARVREVRMEGSTVNGSAGR